MSLSDTLRKWLGSDLQQHGWDAYDAKPIETRTIEVAIAIAERLEGLVINGRPISVEPSNDGTICFSDGDESVYLTLLVLPPEDDDESLHRPDSH